MGAVHKVCQTPREMGSKESVMVYDRGGGPNSSKISENHWRCLQCFPPTLGSANTPFDKILDECLPISNQPRSVTIFNGGPALNQEGPQDSVKFCEFEDFGEGGRIREFQGEFEGG